MSTFIATPDLIEDLETAQEAFDRGDLKTILDLLIRRAAEMAVDRQKIAELDGLLEALYFRHREMMERNG